MDLMLSEGRGQVKNQEMKMLLECHATHVFWLFWDVKLDRVPLGRRIQWWDSFFYLICEKVNAKTKVEFPNSKFAHETMTAPPILFHNYQNVIPFYVPQL